MSHIILQSVIDVECVNSVSNRSKDIISLIALYTWVMPKGNVYFDEINTCIHCLP